MRKLSLIRKAVRLLPVILLICLLANVSGTALAVEPTLTQVSPVDGAEYTHQDNVTLIAEMAGAFPDNAYKRVIFIVNGRNYSAVTDASGVASYTLTGLGAAEYDWSVVYFGDSYNDAVGTPIRTFTVELAIVEVDFTGEDGGVLWEVDGTTIYHSVIGSLTLSDMFGEQAKNLMPGAEVSASIKLKNSSRRFSYTFYVQARPLDQDGTEQLADEFFPDKDATESQKLLASIDAIVTYKPDASTRATPREVYSGKLGAGTRSEIFSSGGAWLGTLSPSQTGTITIDVKIPDDLGSEFMNSICNCKWVFIASDHLRDPITRVQEEEPVVEFPEIEEPPRTEPDPDITGTLIGEDDVPKDETGFVGAVDTGLEMPKTGGIRTFVLPLVIILLLLCALLAVTYLKKRNEKERKAAE